MAAFRLPPSRNHMIKCPPEVCDSTSLFPAFSTSSNLHRSVATDRACKGCRKQVTPPVVTLPCVYFLFFFPIFFSLLIWINGILCKHIQSTTTRRHFHTVRPSHSAHQQPRIPCLRRTNTQMKGRCFPPHFRQTWRHFHPVRPSHFAHQQHFP